MGKRLLSLFIIITLLFLICFTIVISLLVNSIMEENNRTTKEHLKELGKIVSQNYLLSNQYDSKIENLIVNYYNNEERLLLLTIYVNLEDKKETIVLLAKNKNFLKYPNISEDILKNSRPQYTENSLALLGTEFHTYPLEYPQGYIAEGLYVLLGFNDIEPLLFGTLIVFGCYLLLTLVIFLILPKKQQKETISHRVEEKRKQTEYNSQRPQYRPTTEPADSGHVNNTSARNLFSPHTGLGWKDYLSQRLKFELERAASFDQELILALISIDKFEQLEESGIIYSKIAKSIIENFRFQDLVFEYSPGTYALIILDRNIDEGLQILESFKNKISSQNLFDQRITLTIGLSARSGRLIDEKTILYESQKSLEKAKDEGHNQMMAFKADAGKYRETISRKIHS